MEMRVVERWVDFLNFGTIDITFFYLGLPIGVNPRAETTWRPMLEKIKKKLSSWKQKNLAFTGKICLINSILSSLPLFYIYFFKMPSSVVRKVVALQRNFLWGKLEESIKISWLSWKKVCSLRSWVV